MSKQPTGALQRMLEEPDAWSDDAIQAAHEELGTRFERVVEPTRLGPGSFSSSAGKGQPHQKAQPRAHTRPDWQRKVLGALGDWTGRMMKAKGDPKRALASIFKPILRACLLLVTFAIGVALVYRGFQDHERWRGRQTAPYMGIGLGVGLCWLAAWMAGIRFRREESP